jgi:hypothetical protein
MYPGPPLPEEWAYIVDDHSIAYGPGPWPFYRLSAHGQQPEPSEIRVAPDSEFVSWGHEYVTLRPDQFGCVNTTIHVEIRRCITVRVELRFDLRKRSWLIGDRCPEQIREQAEAKAARLTTLINTGFAERDAGAARPITAYDQWTARQGKSTALAANTQPKGAIDLRDSKQGRPGPGGLFVYLEKQYIDRVLI